MSERDPTGSDFDAYFEALWGKTPFPWQAKLARRLLGEDPANPESDWPLSPPEEGVAKGADLRPSTPSRPLLPSPQPLSRRERGCCDTLPEGGGRGEGGGDPDNPQCDWPQAITLPTAAGKTACIDIAIFALAAQASRREQGKPMTAPRRIFFVVDRRVIVDEAFTRANCLAMRLALAQDGILRTVADRLRRLAGGDKLLACFQLRGGIYRSDAWARSPIQPTVVCSTVDQIGSRLLFRSYGRSPKGWHLEAGLAGNDALILLDEAHCAQPFLDTLKAVGKYREWAEEQLPLPFRTVVMTATPPPGVTPFPDPQTAADDRAHEVLKRRLEAKKPCRLEIAERAKGKDAAKVSRALAEKLVQEAERLVGKYVGEGTGTTDTLPTSAPADTPGQPAVAIFCNRVATARAVFDQLHKRKHKAVLLTGRMRAFDKDEILAGPLADLDAAKAEARRLEAPLFVAATQTLEVGANLDFDLMVTECADLSALRQRFGRLNRMGRKIPAQGVIVVRADQTEEQDDSEKADPVYGNALPLTWQWLRKQRDAESPIDMGVSALEPRLKDEDPERLKRLTTEVKRAPVMLPAHLDALVQTAPAPLPGPEPSLFLHGPRTGPADIQICWRADLDPKQKFDRGIEERDAAWIETIGLCPPPLAS